MQKGAVLQSLRLQFGVMLCEKARKSIKSYAKTQNNCVNTCTFQNNVVSLQQKKKQITIKPQDPEGHKQNEILPSFNQQQVRQRSESSVHTGLQLRFSGRGHEDHETL